MPTISQLPSASVVSPSDEIPISQAGSVHATSVGLLLQTAQPVITVTSPSLLGRVSLGPGSPEQIEIGLGMNLQGSTVVANGADHATYPMTGALAIDSDLVISCQGSQMLMPTELLRGLFSAGSNVAIDGNGVISSVGNPAPGQIASVGTAIGALQVASSLAAQDLVPISQSGATRAVSYASFLNGMTIDQAQSATSAADSDRIWVAQSTNVMASQTFSAVWAWISAKLPAYKSPVVEITASLGLDGAFHNGRVLVCSQPITLTPMPANMGSGFQCQVLNVSTGNILLGAGFSTSTGSFTIGPQQSATVQCLTYSGGTIAYASMPQALAAVSPPGQVILLTASSITSAAVSLTWAQPVAGGVPTTYLVQYRQTGSGAWTGSSSATSLAYLVSGLQASTTYDFSVQASNAGGSGVVSQVLTVSTAAVAQAPVPAQVTGLTAVSMSSSTVQLSWSGQSGANAATSFTVQYRIAAATGWTTTVPGLSATSYLVTGLVGNTSYAFSVLGVNGSGSGPASTVATATTATAPGNSVSSIVWNVVPGGTYSHASGAIGINAHISPATSAVQFGFSTSASTPPVAWTAGSAVNSDLWGAYVPTPITAGNWYAWVEGSDGSCPTVSPTPFVVQ